MISIVEVVGGEHMWPPLEVVDPILDASCYCNGCQIVAAIRIGSHVLRCTPAVQAGVTSHSCWGSIAQLILCFDLKAGGFFVGLSLRIYANRCVYVGFYL